VVSGILLSVPCDTPDEIKRAKDVLQATKAEDVSSTGEASVDNKQTDRAAATRAGRCPVLSRRGSLFETPSFWLQDEYHDILI